MIRATTAREPRAWIWGRWAVRVVGTVPLIVGGARVLASTGGGLYWVVAGIVFGIVGAVSNAWVLLVEILRRVAKSARMNACAGLTNAVTPSSPATSATSPVGHWWI